MGNESATFAVNLGGDFTHQALTDAQSADALAEAIEGDLEALKAMQNALRNLKNGAMGSSAAAKDLKEQIAAQKTVVAANQAAMLKTGVTVRDVTRAKREAAAIQKAADRDAARQLLTSQKEQQAALKANVASQQQVREVLGAVAAQLSSVTGAAGGFLSKAQSLAGVMTKTGGVVGAITIAFIALTAATVGATVALAAYAVRVVDARRAELLRLEGLTKIPNWFGIAAGKASDMQAAIDRVSGTVALGRDKISEYAESLYRMGLRGKNLDSALEAAAIRGSVLGEEMGKSFASMAAGAALTGQSVQAMSKRVKDQLGGLAQRQMLSFSVQTLKLKENIDALFRDVKIDGFLAKFKVITDLFSQSTVTGRALKQVLEVLLNPLLGQAKDGAPLLKKFFQGIVIGSQEIVIALLKARLWWLKTFGPETKNSIDWIKVALWGGVGAVFTMVAAVALLTVGIGALAAGAAGLLVLLMAPFVGAAYCVYAVGKAVFWLYDQFRWLFENAKSIDWSEIGLAILRGIGNATIGILDAGVRLGKRMLEGFKSVWEIKSPSRVARRLVEVDIGRGASIGAERAGSRVGKTLGRALMPTASGSAGAGVAYSTGGNPASLVRDVPYPSANVGGGNSDNVRRGGLRGGVTIQNLLMQLTLPESDRRTQGRVILRELAAALESAGLELAAETD